MENDSAVIRYDAYINLPAHEIDRMIYEAREELVILRVDRGFKSGDMFVLNEVGADGVRTGSQWVGVVVKVLRGLVGMDSGHCVLCLRSREPSSFGIREHRAKIAEIRAELQESAHDVDLATKEIEGKE